jgi:hypothetical protein
VTRRDFLLASAIVWSTTALTAIVVAVVPGGAAALRTAFAFRFEFAAGTWPEATDYFLTNLRTIAALLLAAWMRSRRGPLGWFLDASVLAVVVANAAVVGAAVGAYGARALVALVHLPLEWCALSVALAAALASRRSRLPRAAITRVAVVAAVLLVSAALMESFGIR